MAKILAVNAGSSSLKFQVMESDDFKVLMSGLIEAIGLKEAAVNVKIDANKKTIKREIVNHQEAVKILLELLISEKVVSDLKEIEAIGHRVVHGGEKYHQSVLLTPEVAKEIERISELAPLHNPANLLGYYSFSKALPHAKHVAVFDTAFHQSMEKHVYLYPLPYEYYEQHQIRRYGFHGTSHRYVAQEVAKYFKNDSLKIVVCHLGNGASITAVKNGQSINTTMGFTPLAGVMMGTRSGDIDPAIVAYLANKLKTDADGVINILNKKSGFLGVSGVSSDGRAIEEAIAKGHEKSILARQMYAHIIAERVASFVIDLGGLDVIAFTAGIGENDIQTREAIGLLLEPLGAQLDIAANNVRGQLKIISTPQSKVKMIVVPTNEELMIVKDTVALTGGK